MIFSLMLQHTLYHTSSLTHSFQINKPLCFVNNLMFKHNFFSSHEMGRKDWAEL